MDWRKKASKIASCFGKDLTRVGSCSHGSTQVAGKTNSGRAQTLFFPDLRFSWGTTALPFAISTQSPSYTPVAHYCSWCWIQRTKSHSCLLPEFPEKIKTDIPSFVCLISTLTMYHSTLYLNFHKQIKKWKCFTKHLLILKNLHFKSSSNLWMYKLIKFSSAKHYAVYLKLIQNNIEC